MQTTPKPVILPWRGVRARRAIDRYLRLCQPARVDGGSFVTGQLSWQGRADDQGSLLAGSLPALLKRRTVRGRMDTVAGNAEPAARRLATQGPAKSGRLPWRIACGGPGWCCLRVSAPPRPGPRPGWGRRA